MKKKEIIDQLLQHPMIGELTEEDLGKMTIPNLKLLEKDLSDELENSETDGNDASDASSLDHEEVGFVSMCGLPFDPAKNAACAVQCAKENPENYKACMENFKAQPERAAAKEKKKSLGMNQWYHRPGTQGGKLDEFFTEGNIGSLEEIAEFANCRKQRVMVHMQHLVADFDVPIKKGQKKDPETKKLVDAYFLAEGKFENRKGVDVPGKTGFPNGFPKNHPCANRD